MTSPILNELLQRTTALRALARELVGDAHADDIVQETAIQTLTAPPKQPAPAGGWLAAVVRNLAGKHRRAERTRHRHEAGAARAEVAPSERSAEDSDILRRLTEVVTSLPEPYRGTILARYLREETPSEIAATTNTPVRTVKTRLQRGLALLRTRLDERSDDWRVMLAVAFALDPVTSEGPILLGKTMKLAISVLLLLPVGYAIWTNGAGSTGNAIEAQVGRGSASSPVVAPSPTDKDPLGNVGRQEGAATLDSDVRSSAAATPEPTSDGVDPIQSSTPKAAPKSLASIPTVGTATVPEAAAPGNVHPLISIDVVGPRAFRAAFQRTNIGALCVSTEGQRLWRPLLAPAEHIWRQWDGRGKDFGPTRERVLDYAGRIRLLWIVQPGKDEEGDHAFGVFALEPDGKTNLNALAGDLSQVLQNLMPQDPTKYEVLGHALQLLGDGGPGFVTVPAVIDGSLVAFFGEAGSLETAVALGLRALASDTEAPTAPVSLEVDLSQLKHLSEVRDETELRELFGLDSLRSFRASLRPNGVHAQIDVAVEFGDGNRGVWAGFFPAVHKLPSLLSRLPHEATPWLTVPFQPSALLRAGMAADAREREVEVDVVRQEMRDELGLFLDVELFDHQAGEVMVLGDLWQARDPEVFRRGDDPALGACIAFALHNTAAFGMGFDKLLQYLKGTVHRYETRDLDGVKITRLGSIFLTGMHVAIGKDLFAMAFGREGITQLESLVAERPQTNDQLLPAAVQRVQHLAPAGWNGVGLADLTALFGGQITLALEMLDDALPEAMGFEFSGEETQEWCDRMLPLIAEHKVAKLVMMTGYDDGHWRMRLLW